MHFNRADISSQWNNIFLNKKDPCMSKSRDRPFSGLLKKRDECFVPITGMDRLQSELDSLVGLSNRIVAPSGFTFCA